MGVGAGLYMYDVVVKKFTFAISSPDEFLLRQLTFTRSQSAANRDRSVAVTLTGSASLT